MFFSDYHTHTVFSHGKGSIGENVAQAAKIGLKEVAISDHSFAHKAYGLRRMDVNEYLQQIKCAQASAGIRVLRGLECNILNAKGDIDLRPEDYKWLDVLICGHHKYVRGAGFKQTFKFNLPVFWANVTKKSSAKRIAANTDAFVKMMDRHPVDIISHPNLGIRVDMKELARACKHYGVFLEINGKGVRFSPSQANQVLEQGGQFIVNSDAHSPDRVGDFLKPIEFIKQAQIPLEAIANYNKLPTFKEKL